MIKTIVIEDEVDARKGLIKMLNLLNPDINVVAQTGYVTEAIAQINTRKPHLVFVDIELEDGTGFEILKKIEYTNFKIIFTTAYSNYAIKAFKYSATDYLLKPISPLELKEAIDKTIIDINTELKYQELLEIVENKEGKKIKNIVLKTTNQRFVISLDTIIRLEADAAYTIFFTKTNKIMVSKNLKYYQDLLDDSFIRCHQSHLVNTEYIKGFKANKLVLSNAETIPVSIRKKSEILQIINRLQQ